MRLRSTVIIAAVVVSAGCGSAGGPEPVADRAAGGALRTVSLPDLLRLDAPVRRQVQQRYDTLAQVLERPASAPAERARAYGSLGMVLDAAEYHDSAEPAYLNAQTLSSDDPRWPYYLAHLYRSAGRNAEAEAAFTRVLALVPDHAATLIWLGRLQLEQANVDEAEALFARARAAAPRAVAALAGLGQAALAREDHARAALLLEEALALDPSAASIHAPLATAYRALGETGRAEAHVRQWRNTDIAVPDPWRRELDLTLDSGLSYELRGIRALERRDFAAAAGFFEQGAALEPATTALGRSLRHKLGTALYLSGQVNRARELFEQVVRSSPAAAPDETAARAHYSLGIMMAARGRTEEALAHLIAAVEYGPNYVEALQALGDALRGAGRANESLAPYRHALSVDPRAADARFGYAMALVRLGRHREALEAFAEGSRLHDDRPEFREAMARVLAASPDDGVRDGKRAMAIVDGLLAGEKTVQLGETAAMALAEVGNYTEAAAVLRQVMKSATHGGVAFDRDRLAAMLAGYERNQPTRTPWADDDPVHHPRPAAATEAVQIPRDGR